MDALETLEQNLQLLIARYQALAEENEQLKKTIADQRDEVMQTHNELVELRRKYGQLQVAHSMTSADSEEKAKAYQRLSNLIAKVDSAIEVLKG